LIPSIIAANFNKVNIHLLSLSKRLFDVHSLLEAHNYFSFFPLPPVPRIFAEYGRSRPSLHLFHLWKNDGDCNYVLEGYLLMVDEILA
jgi:hypothetical protein